ncbi:hypothetical protein EJO66_09140 [Variovorax beijingensis]|uniref:LemA family protein n=1 Tax=Variovorax beijingensis TaxID=2496117 RepID=A0ABY0A9T3_9BURK|nr:hypothetical protein [Variovorax beijingensis]RSZ40287.1 hypothetical protein EJO66_09140 [Variovorax beijingensis]
MKKFYYFAAGGALLCATALVVVFFRHRPSTPSDWAAWAQAGTAAVAIVAAAIAVVWQQLQQKVHQAEAARLEQIRRLQIIGGALFNCRVIVEYLLHEFVQLAGVPVRKELADFDSQLKSLMRIAPLDFPDWPSFHAVETLAQTFRTHEETIARAAETLSERAWDTREKYLNVLLTAVEHAEEIVEGSLGSIGGHFMLVTNTFQSGRVVYSRGHPDLKRRAG